MLVLKIIATVLIADFLSGFFHWLEDAYGCEHWPVTGRLITRPNVLHHHDPRHFTHHSWFHSSWLLICLGLIVLGAAWLCGLITWQVWLVVILGVNANQFHKWAHRTSSENGRLISLLQRSRLIQTPQHHARHHTNPKDSHYCVLTNFLNPILDSSRFWEGLEFIIERVAGVRRRPDTSVRGFIGFSLVLAVIALGGSGCASIGARCGQASPSTYPGVYPGPRNIVQEMETPRGAAHNILIWPFGIIDFPLSAALDTALLPIDAPYWASKRASENQSDTTPDSSQYNHPSRAPMQ